MEARTITRTLRRRTAKGGRKPHLFLVLRCDDPLDTGARVCLEAADTVVLGRGQRQKVERSTMEGAATLRIEMPDRHMSATHARLQRVLGEWMIHDGEAHVGAYGIRSTGLAFPRTHPREYARWREGFRREREAS